MNKEFLVTKFPSSEFEEHLLRAAAPYRGNVHPIQATLEALYASPLNCQTAVFEREYVDMDYQDEFAAFYSKAFKRYPCRAVRVHFFAAQVTVDDLHRIDTFGDHYLGYLILRPIDLQRVGRTVLKPALANPDREFVHCRAVFPVHILGHSLIVNGMPFIQQDTQVGACAQASLWMLARYMSRRFGHREFLPSEINQFAKAKGAMGRALPAEFGLNLRQILDALEAMGLSAWNYSSQALDDCSDHIDAAFPSPRKGTRRAQEIQRGFVRMVKLADIAYRYIESGLPVILCTDNHALVCIGHTYDHKAKATAAIQRIPAFIVHDDASGPYQSMPIFKLHGRNLPFADVEDIIAVVPPEVTLRGEEAESMSRQAIAAFLSLKTGDSKHTTYKKLILHLRPDFRGLLNRLEFRTFLMPSVEFQNKIRQDAADKRFNPALAKRFIELDYPKFIWITEVSSSALLNHPRREDRKCLGRVIIDSTAPSRTRGEMVVHFCDFLAMLDRQKPTPPSWEYVPQTTSFGHQISR
ncbi:MAG: hypothetical protein ABSF95_21515 [Verrucomicrobiota bacterium]|jgi:hypothetical protein